MEITTIRHVISILILVSYFSVQCIVDEEWLGEKWLDHKYLLKWKPISEEKAILFRVEVESNGWVSLGFSRNGRNIDQDLMVGWVNDHQDTVLKVRLNLFQPIFTTFNQLLIRT